MLSVWVRQDAILTRCSTVDEELSSLRIATLFQRTMSECDSLGEGRIRMVKIIFNW